MRRFAGIKGRKGAEDSGNRVEERVKGRGSRAVGGKRWLVKNRLLALPQLSNSGRSWRNFNAVFRRQAYLIEDRCESYLSSGRSIFRCPLPPPPTISVRCESHSNLHNEAIKYFACIPRTAQICDNLRQLSRLDRYRPHNFMYCHTHLDTQREILPYVMAYS